MTNSEQLPPQFNTFDDLFNYRVNTLFDSASSEIHRIHLLKLQIVANGGKIKLTDFDKDAINMTVFHLLKLLPVLDAMKS